MTDSLSLILSPKSSSGSIWWSIVAHAGICGLALVFLSFHGPSRSVATDYMDLGYETFDAPPVPTQEVRKVMASPTPLAPVKADVVPDNSQRELQDEKSDIAGTQKAQPVQSHIGSEGTGQASSTPYYKIRPKYPRAALMSGTEGWVLMEVDITEVGEVENVRVIDGEQRNTFESEARRAVEQWKYRPFLDASGNPVRKLAHHVRVDFKLQEEAASL